MQRILYIIIAALIIYTAIENKAKKTLNEIEIEKKSSTESTNHSDKDEMQGNFLEKLLSTILANTLKTESGKEAFSKLIQPQNVNPLSDVPMKIEKMNIAEKIFQITTSGNSNDIGPASCGHSVNATYKIVRKSDNVIVEENTKIFVLGSRDVMYGLENIIVGMHKGQTRTGIIPAQFAYSRTNNSKKINNVEYKAEVKLLDIIPKTFLNTKEIRIFDDTMSTKVPYLCGTPANFDLTISNLKGEILYNTLSSNKRIQIILGDINYPIIFSHGLFEKAPDGTRTILTPGKFLRAFGNKDNNRIIPQNLFPDEEFFLIDLFNFETQNINKN